MTRYLKAAILIGAGILLASCKFEAIAPIYVADLIDVAETGTPIRSSIELNIQIPSADTCEEYANKIRNSISQFFKTFDMRGCEKKGFENYAKVNVESEITGNVSEAGIYFVVSKNNSILDVTLSQTPDFTNLLIEAIKKEIFGEINLSFSVRLSNDTRGKIMLRTQNVFVNQRAYAKPGYFQLERRDEYVIRLSDVGVSAFQNGENIAAFSITPI